MELFFYAKDLLTFAALASFPANVYVPKLVSRDPCWQISLRLRSHFSLCRLCPEVSFLKAVVFPFQNIQSIHLAVVHTLCFVY